MVLELELHLGLEGRLPCGRRMGVRQRKELMPRYGLRLRVEGRVQTGLAQRQRRDCGGALRASSGQLEILERKGSDKVKLSVHYQSGWKTFIPTSLPSPWSLNSLWAGRPLTSSICWRQRWWGLGRHGRGRSTEGRSPSRTWSGVAFHLARKSPAISASCPEPPLMYFYCPRHQLVSLGHVLPSQFIALSVKSSHHLSLYHPSMCILPHCCVAKLGQSHMLG